VSGQLHAPTALPQGKSPCYPLDRRLGGHQSRSGRGGEEKNSQLPPEIEPKNPDRPARSPALCRLNYLTLTHTHTHTHTHNVKLSLRVTKHHVVKTYPLLNQAPCHVAYSSSADTTPRILNLSTRWMWVASFSPWQLYPRGMRPWYPLDMRLGGPQSRSGRGGSKKKIWIIISTEWLLG
jgi:hypothetical protein